VSFSLRASTRTHIQLAELINNALEPGLNALLIGNVDSESDSFDRSLGVPVLFECLYQFPSGLFGVFLLQIENGKLRAFPGGRKACMSLQLLGPTEGLDRRYDGNSRFDERSTDHLPDASSSTGNDTDFARLPETSQHIFSPIVRSSTRANVNLP